RNIIKKIKNTAADEEYIAMKIKQNNLKGYYAKNAIINNYGPKNISDLIKQRRRIHWGHLELIKKNTYKTASLNYITIFKEIIKIIKVNNFYIIIFAIILEGYSRLLGSIDYYINKNYYIWEISKSTKK
ncbi:hypothetical protein HN415_02935, partial [Candidatus Woesearchaeota archaeon]|nr:hypothetical protein [Candidatus Woesearchaeota archaeon]